MALNNTYDRSRDARLSRRPSNIEMPDVVSAVSTPRIETAPLLIPSLATTSSNGDLTPTRCISDLLARIADQQADNTRLQQEKTVAKEMARDLHVRLNQTTQSLTALTTSYAKRLGEKNTILNENVAIEQRHTKMRAETAEYAREISAMTTKIQEMQAQIQTYEVENAELRDHLTMLETESQTLQRRVSDLELGQRQGRIVDNAVQDAWNHRDDSMQDPRSGLNAPSLHHDTNRNRDVRYSEAVYIEHRRRSGGFYEGDTYRPGPRREREGHRNVRNRASEGDRFNVYQPPATGLWAERR